MAKTYAVFELNLPAARSESSDSDPAKALIRGVQTLAERGTPEERLQILRDAVELVRTLAAGMPADRAVAPISQVRVETGVSLAA